MGTPEDRIAIFREKTIRRSMHKGQWWFVINDVVQVLTGSSNPNQYLKNMRRRDTSLDSLFNEGGVQIEPPLGIQFDTTGGPQKLLCWNTEAILRLVQSIPSPKAEPFKRWLAKVGYERVQEIEDPELSTTRSRALYKAKGYSNEWIERRMRGIVIREELADEWGKHGIRRGRDYSILTSEISKATFGMTPSAHKKLKQLKHENLRDHMTDLEQIFSMLGEASTTEIVRTENARGFSANHKAARRGGAVAGNARRQLEAETGQPVVTANNYLSVQKEQAQQKLEEEI